MWTRVGLALMIVATGGAAGIAAQPDPTTDLLARSAEYLRHFVERFSNVVAEEHYLQQSTNPRRSRRLTSDFLLVVYPGATEWFPFRDVREVDGKPVPRDQERLLTLFAEPPRDARRRIEDIVRTSARHNLVDMGTLNSPLLALAFLQDLYRQRFRFTRGSIDKSVGPDVRLVRYQEWSRPTVLRTDTNGDLPAQGRVWIEERTGAVVKTELEVGGGRFPTQITTSFAFDSELQIHVPAEMREWYPDGTGQVTGLATYGRFRRFQVQTDATIHK